MKTVLTPIFLLAALAMLSAQSSVPFCSAEILQSHATTSVHHDFQNAVRPRTVTYLPVVVHIVYNSPAYNFSDQKIHSLLEKANEDFRRMNADTVNTPDAFKPFAADTQIEFVLAAADPLGNPTTGITRTMTGVDFFSNMDGTIANMKYDSTGGKSAWDTHHFVNIWIASIMGTTAYSTYPWLHGTPSDGVVISSTAPQSIMSRLLTHELGHYLGLVHTSGAPDACEPGDGIDDTPPQFSDMYLISGNNCPDFPFLDQCSPEFPGVMFMNFMDVTWPSCMNMFTHGQAAAMLDIIMTERSTLLNPILVDTENPLIDETSTSMQLFPNPANASLFVQFDQVLHSDRFYIIYDGLGRLAKQVNTGAAHDNLPEDELDIRALPSGIYWLKCHAGEQVFLQKFLKQ